MSLPLARTIILTDAGTMAYTEELAAYDGTPAGTGTVTPTPAPTPTPTPTPASISVDPTVRRSGNDYLFTLRRDGNLSSPLAYPMKAAASADYPPGSPASDWPNGAYQVVTANFSAGAATASITITAPVAAQPE